LATIPARLDHLLEGVASIWAKFSNRSARPELCTDRIDHVLQTETLPKWESQTVNDTVDARIDSLLLDELDRWEDMLLADEAPTPPELDPANLAAEVHIATTSDGEVFG